MKHMEKEILLSKKKKHTSYRKACVTVLSAHTL